MWKSCNVKETQSVCLLRKAYVRSKGSGTLNFFSLAFHLKWSMKIKVMRIIRVPRHPVFKQVNPVVHIYPPWNSLWIKNYLHFRWGSWVPEPWQLAQGRSSGKWWGWHSITAHSVQGVYAPSPFYCLLCSLRAVCTTP